MNNELFQNGRNAYAAKDYQGALNAFDACLQDASQPLEAGEIGLVYHQLGNCLVKLRNPEGAIQAYTQATADTAYDAVGTVNYNLGMAYASLRDYDNAIQHFEIAVSDRTYATPYKAFTGMGNALMKMGKSAEAGVAFREAALDETNPDPTKALLNLGVCFMALNRPADAVASYESALQFRMAPDAQNKLYANLGQAYVASGQMQKAVEAFEKAIADKTYFLSDSASVDYQRAIGAVSQGTSEIAPVGQAPADMSGLDIVSDETAALPVQQDPAMMTGNGYPPYNGEDGVYNQQMYPGQSSPYGTPDGQPDDRFFTASEAELEQWSKANAKKSRKGRHTVLKVFLVLFLILALLAGGAAFLYTQGYGYPTQEAVAQQLFSDPTGAGKEVFASDIDAAKVTSMVTPLVKDSNATIDGMNKSMNESTVYVSAKTPEGGTVKYKVSMIRDNIGWKVSNVELFFNSTN